MAIKRLHVGPRLSEAAIHNGVVYLAGQVADDASQDAAGQTRQILAAIDRLLGEAGSDKSHLLQVTIFLADISDFPMMNGEWDQWVPKGQTPPRATVEAKLARPDFKVEIKVIAAQK
jgi:enamine deaminase RidA (YjgF/YER057c/UK114 family)